MGYVLGSSRPELCSVVSFLGAFLLLIIRCFLPYIKLKDKGHNEKMQDGPQMQDDWATINSIFRKFLGTF